MTSDLTVLAVVLAAAIGSMGFFTLGSARGPGGPGRSDDRSFALGPFLRDWFFWALGPVLRVSLALGATPTFFNVLGLLFAVAAGVSFSVGGLALGGWLVLFGGISDSLDGRVARARDMDGAHGAFLDSVLDRFGELAVFVGLAVHFSFEPIAGPLILAAAGGSLLVSYARARGESLGVQCTRGVMQRAERLLLVGLSAICDSTVTALVDRGESGALLLPALGLIALGTVGTAIYRSVWIVRRLVAEKPERWKREGSDAT